jgi:hypothetical protein
MGAQNSPNSQAECRAKIRKFQSLRCPVWFRHYKRDLSLVSRTKQEVVSKIVRKPGSVAMDVVNVRAPENDKENFARSTVTREQVGCSKQCDTMKYFFHCCSQVFGLLTVCCVLIINVTEAIAPLVLRKENYLVCLGILKNLCSTCKGRRLCSLLSTFYS